MVRNIVFDIGNVLISFQPKPYLDSLFSGDIAEKVYSAVFGSKEWLQLDRGDFSEEEAVSRFQANCPELSEEIKTAAENLYDGMLHPLFETAAYLKELKNRGYSIFLLSNYQNKAFAYIKSRNDFFDCIDGMVLSFREKQMKPHKEIYLTLLGRYQLNSRETVFIDDTPENIAAAAGLGIKGIVFTEIELLRQDLENILRQK